jgi:hypothetical protein
MKVFLSWSGTLSYKVACVFRDWLPKAFKAISEAFVSLEDIDKGTKGGEIIAAALKESSVGILCLTRENINAPWVLYEAGALSNHEKAYVCPFLFDIKETELGSGPISQYQYTLFEKEDLKRLTKTLNKACGQNAVSADQLDSAFETWYPELENALNAIMNVEERNLPIIRISGPYTRSGADNQTASLQTRIKSAQKQLFISGNDMQIIKSERGPLENAVEREIIIKFLLADPYSLETSGIPLRDSVFKTTEVLAENVNSHMETFKSIFGNSTNCELRLLPFMPTMGFFITDPDLVTGSVRVEFYTSDRNQPRADHERPGFICEHERPNFLFNRKSEGDWYQYFLDQWDYYWDISDPKYAIERSPLLACLQHFWEERIFPEIKE